MLKSQKGFTLIEMLIVLMIISVLIILIVPNLGKKSEEVYRKGCEALVSVVQAQVDAYRLEVKSYPANLNVLENAGYITTEQKECPSGDQLTIDTPTGKVRIIPSKPE